MSPKTAKPTRPLSCYRCGATDAALSVETDTDYAQVEGARRVVTTVRCLSCRKLWQSRHPDAVKRARAQRAA